MNNEICGYCKKEIILSEYVEGVPVFCDNKCLASHKKETNSVVKIKEND